VPSFDGDRADPDELMFVVVVLPVASLTVPVAVMLMMPVFIIPVVIVMVFIAIPVVAFLGKGGSGWKVLNLQARGDVPDGAEVAQLRASLPSDYPLSIVNKFWRDLLRGEGKSD
jgi:hypothetical protein